MIHKQERIPVHASIGDVWTDEKSFKRVLSRGGAWENVNLGARHPDEVSNEQVTQPEAQLGNDGTEVSGGAGESAPGNGDDGQTVPESGLGTGAANTGLPDDSAPIEVVAHPTAQEGPGIDANGSDVF